MSPGGNLGDTSGKGLADVVAIGAHPDDAEIAMAGSLASFVRQGFRVAIVDLTNGEPTPHGSEVLRAREALAAAKALGVKRLTLELPNRKLFDTVEARETLAIVLRRLRPWLLFLPYPSDAHPDHWEGSSLAMAGRFYSKLTKTDMPGKPWYPPRVMYHFATHMGHAPQPSLLLDVTRDFGKKLASIRCYRSQFFRGGRRGEILETLEVRARFYGNLIGAKYAEAFHTPEPPGFSTLNSLVIPAAGTLGRARGKKR